MSTYHTSKATFFFPRKETRCILTTPLVHSIFGDRLTWHFTSRGNFTVRYAYGPKCSVVGQPLHATGSMSSFNGLLWKIKVPPKVQHLIWCCLRDANAISCHSLLQRGYPIADSTCIFVGYLLLGCVSVNTISISLILMGTIYGLKLLSIFWRICKGISAWVFDHEVFWSRSIWLWVVFGMIGIWFLLILANVTVFFTVLVIVALFGSWFLCSWDPFRNFIALCTNHLITLNNISLI